MTLQPLKRAWFAGLCAAAVSAGSALPASPDRSDDQSSSHGSDCRLGLCSTICRCLFDQFDPDRRIRYGYGMVADPARAAYWYRRAAASGDLRAQYNLALLLRRGEGVSADPEEAVRLLEDAADRGLAEAAQALGNMHRTGEGVPLDLEAAARRYDQAARAGHAPAQHALGNLHADGRSVVADRITAWLWWHRAIERGHQPARAALTRAERLMSRDEIARARRRAGVAMPDPVAP